MPSNRSNSGIGPLLQALFATDVNGQTDGQLLHLFLTQGDQAAFAALVRRHGPMALGVCRRILGNAADADDAFQAAFLVLIRKARALTSRATVGDWLHGVARHTALKARAAAAHRRAKEQTAARPEVQAYDPRNDWLPRLDEELGRLPQKYRQPIVLCDLEGKTRQQAAQQLGWPLGTVAGRLARGRALLAKRLLRGAQVLSGGVAGTLWSGDATAAVPLALVQSTIQAATVIASGHGTAKGVLSVAALALAKGVLRTMFWNKVKTFGLVLMATIVLAGVGGRTVQILTAQEQGSQKAVGQPDKPGQPPRAAGAQPDKPIGQPPSRLGEEYERQIAETVIALNAKSGDEGLLNVARIQWEARCKEYLAGKVTVDKLMLWSPILLKAELRVLKKKSEIVAAHEAHLKRMRDTEAVSREKYEAGSIPITEYAPAVYYRIEAEIWLHEAKAAK